MTPVYLHDWAAGGFTAVVCDFEGIYLDAAEFANPSNDRTRSLRDTLNRALARPEYQVNVLLASYASENYSGDAFVLFEKDGRLFEVNGSHCSCFGLEGQWKPEETDCLSLWDRLTKGRLGHDDWTGNEFRDELLEVLRQWAQEHPGEYNIPQ